VVDNAGDGAAGRAVDGPRERRRAWPCATPGRAGGGACGAARSC